MTITTSYQPSRLLTFDEFKAICKRHGLTQSNPNVLRMFYFNKHVVVKYNTQLNCPVAWCGLLSPQSFPIESVHELILYIEQAKQAISELIEKEATMELLDQIEQL